jgi:predicted metal-dependent phosphoesterase TrpH
VPGVDLHVHTNASDGRFPPAEIVARAVEAGVSVLAITDHDTVSGIDAAMQAAASFPALKLIVGVEINTDIPDGEAHILGYFFDHTNPELLSLLHELRVSRHERGRAMIARLEALGMPLSWERVREIANTEAIGRPHIALAMLEKGYVVSLREAFDRFIAFGKPAYVERTKVSPALAADVISKAHGLPVLAHPFALAEPEKLIGALTEHGLAGIEVYYGGYSRDQVSRLRNLAQRYSLLATGGSDFHGLAENAETPLGQSGVPMKAARALIAMAERTAKSSNQVGKDGAPRRGGGHDS